jgi:hypothetical protein
MIEGLTFFVELPGRELLELLRRPGLLDSLRRSGAALSVAMLDLSEERRQAMAALQARGIPLTAWLTVAEDHGYWLCADNAPQALERYEEVRAWLRRNGLRVEAVGLDLEPPQQDVQALLGEGRRALLRLLRRRRSRTVLKEALELYSELILQIRTDGYRAETYQLPLILDERRAGTSLLQRTLGLLDLPADREVVMLYESLLPPPLGSLLVDSYGPECEAIGVGISGGGVPFVLQAIGSRRLQGQRLLETLGRARRYTPHLYVFSLEGCLQSGSLEVLLEGDGGLLPAPAATVEPGRLLRSGLHLLLRAERLAEWL